MWPSTGSQDADTLHIFGHRSLLANADELHIGVITHVLIIPGIEV
jgi:hypothetical protein